MEIDVFFVRENVLTKQLTLHHVPTFDQRAYTLTKPFSPNKFVFLRAKHNVSKTSSKSQPP